jgi:hypothetical protein
VNRLKMMNVYIYWGFKLVNVLQVDENALENIACLIYLIKLLEIDHLDYTKHEELDFHDV